MANFKPLPLSPPREFTFSKNQINYKKLFKKKQNNNNKLNWIEIIAGIPEFRNSGIVTEEISNKKQEKFKKKQKQKNKQTKKSEKNPQKKFK